MKFRLRLDSIKWKILSWIIFLFSIQSRWRNWRRKLSFPIILIVRVKRWESTGRLMGKTNWELRDWEPQPYLGLGGTFMRVTRTISCGVSCHVSCVTGGMEWQRVRFRFLRRGGGRKERERERWREKHNSHSVILEKLSPGTSKEIESVDDETSPAKYDKTLKKKLSHFLWRLFLKWLNANCGKRNDPQLGSCPSWIRIHSKFLLNT